MAIVTGFTAERTQEIEDSTIVAGLVAVNGRLLLERRDGGQIDAGNVVGPKGSNAIYSVGSFPGGTAHYSRLAVIDGVSATAGGSIEFVLSGLGGYGTAKRATIIVHAAQRGSNIFSIRTWALGFEDSTVPLTLYSRQTGEFMFELWGLFAPYSMSAGMTVLASQNAVVSIDSASPTQPAALVTHPIDNVAVERAGSITMFGALSAPYGWLVCDGTAVSRTIYSALYSVIGTSYGIGDGTSTFNVPNLKGKIPVGIDTAQAEFDILGETGGSKNHTLSGAEMPIHTHVQAAHNHTQNSHNHTQNSHNHTQNSHNHTQDSHNHSQSAHAHASYHRNAGYKADGTGTATTALDGVTHGFNQDGESVIAVNVATTATNNVATAVNQVATAVNQVATAVNQAATAVNENAGSDMPHNNLQPYVVVNYIIKT